MTLRFMKLMDGNLCTTATSLTMVFATANFFWAVLPRQSYSIMVPEFVLDIAPPAVSSL